MATLEQYAQIVTSVATIAIVSRLLDSTDIGIGVIGLGIGMIAFTVREFATSEYLIQRENIDAETVRTGFTLIFCLSFAIACILCVFSGAIARFYDHSQIETFIWIMAVAGIIEAVSCPIAALLRRDMDFGTLTRINTLAGLANTVTVVSIAWQGGGFMSFAWGMLAAAALRGALSLHARPVAWMFRPHLAGSRAVFAFGTYKGASTVFDRLYEALPQLVLGHIMPFASVGIFNRANLVCGLPDKILLSAVFSVAFPAFSAQVREGRDVKASYLRMISYLTVIYWPATLVLAVLAYPIVRIVLGADWLETVPIIQILACAAVFYFANILTFPVLMALGHNRDAFVSNFIGRGLSTMVIAAASFHGLTVLALSQFVTLPFQMYVSLHYVRRYLPFAWSEFFAALYGSLAVTLLTVAGPLFVLASNDFVSALSLFQSAVCCLLALAGWIAGLILVRHPFLDEALLLAGDRLPLFRPLQSLSDQKSQG
ncbi:MAG: oligosaccharide flippase family protein [Shinella sp.]|nr:oligosaccharide flippase family protein [Shinella sp.]